MTTTQIQDKCRGSLVGGAAGDTLGYEVEFMTLESIRKRFGDRGITNYVLDSRGMAEFSDDTQMTLYTAEGLLEAVNNGKPVIPLIRDSYLAWFGGQAGKKVKTGYDSKLASIDELNQQRAPGNTCMSALISLYSGKKPKNSSKGCGGVMRVAPIGLYGATHGWSLEKTARLAGETAELTHLHPLSTYSSAAQAVIVQLCVSTEGPIGRLAFSGIVDKSLEVVGDLYGVEAPYMDDFRNIIRMAISLEEDARSDWDIIENSLGGGWVAEETLAIAIFSVLRHVDDFDACMICAVNHGGDSDSTGAVAGNILGAVLGYQALPDKFKENLELNDLLLFMGDEIVIS